MFLICLLAVKAGAVSWQSDLDSALKSAKNSGQLIMIDFYTDWCHWCKKLDSDTYSSGKVNDFARKFICVKIDADKNPALTRKYGVSGYPTVIFLASNGDSIGKIIGYRGPEEFAKSMEEALKNFGGLKPSGDLKPDPAKNAGEPRFDMEELKRTARKSIERMKNYNLDLGGILYNPKAPKAVINDTIVKVGDVIEGAKVVAIDKEKVDLVSGDKKIQLKLPE